MVGAGRLCDEGAAYGAHPFLQLNRKLSAVDSGMRVTTDLFIILEMVKHGFEGRVVFVKTLGCVGTSHPTIINKRNPVVVVREEVFEIQLELQDLQGAVEF